MDPISLTASVVTIFGVSVKAYQFGRGLAGAQDEIKAIVTGKNEVQRHLHHLDEILARLPEHLVILLDSLKTFENYTRKMKKTAKSIDQLIQGLGLRDSSLRSKAAASIKWTIKGKKAKVNAMMTHLGCLREALLTDCATSVLAEVVDQWVASRTLNKELELRIQELRDELRSRRLEALDDATEEEESICDDVEKDEGEALGETAVEARERAEAILLWVDLLIGRSQTAIRPPASFNRPHPTIRSMTAPVQRRRERVRTFSNLRPYAEVPYAYPQQALQQQPPLRIEVLEWLSQAGSDVPSDIAPSSSLSWPTHVSPISMNISV